MVLAERLPFRTTYLMLLNLSGRLERYGPLISRQILPFLLLHFLK